MRSERGDGERAHTDTDTGTHTHPTTNTHEQYGGGEHDDPKDAPRLRSLMKRSNLLSIAPLLIRTACFLLIASS